MEMGTKIEFDNVFQDEEHFFTYLVNEVFKQNNIHGDVMEIDYESDASRRVFVLMVDGKEITIRTWNIYDTDEKVIVDYSIYEENV
jgi:hypothetical protein